MNIFLLCFFLLGSTELTEKKLGIVLFSNEKVDLDKRSQKQFEKDFPKDQDFEKFLLDTISNTVEGEVQSVRMFEFSLSEASTTDLLKQYFAIEPDTGMEIQKFCQKNNLDVIVFINWQGGISPEFPIGYLHNEAVLVEKEPVFRFYGHIFNLEHESTKVAGIFQLDHKYTRPLLKYKDGFFKKEAIAMGLRLFEKIQINYIERPLLWAISDDNPELCLSILKAGNYDKSMVDFFGQNALHYTSKLGWYNVSEKLISAGFHVDSLTKGRTTPLMLAVSNEHFDIAELLLNSGANYKIKDKQRRNAMHFSGNNKKKFKELIEKYK